MKEYLKVIENYLKDCLCSKMNLSALEKIEIVDRYTLPKGVYTRTDGNTILVSVEMLEDLMSDIPDIENYLKNDISEMCEKVRLALKDLYHEFCHIDERTVMPNIHCIPESDQTNFLEKIIAHFWVEFVVECRSNSIGFCQRIDLCNSFIKKNWEVKYFEVNEGDTKDLYYFMYCLPYFISACYINDNFDYYLSKIFNKNIRKLAEELYSACIDLHKDMPFDNYDKIKIIESILERNIDTKSKEFELLYQIY